jgi:peptide/nickel transport system substrate-binding protein
MPKFANQPRLLMRSFSFLAVLMLVLAACGATSAATAPSLRSGGRTPVRGGTWIDDLLGGPDSLLPNFSSETSAALVDDALWAPLIYGTPQGQLMPGLATEVPTVANGGVSPDLLAVTFHLRKGLLWSDGQPLDARDVDFSWRLWSIPQAAAYNTVFVTDIARAEVSRDHLAITFHLKAPLVSFVSQWADGSAAPLPAHLFASIDPAMLAKSLQNLDPQVTSGPFLLRESRPGDHFTLVRNPRYYLAEEGLPYLDQVVFRIAPDQHTILKDLQAGTVDSSWSLDVSQAGAYQRLGGYTVVADPNAYGWEGIWFNFRNQVLADHPEVRQAIAMTTDQQALVQIARHGLAGARCTDHSPLQIPGYTAGLGCPQLHPDFQAANALLAQHGWVKGADGVRARDGVRLEFQYSTTQGNRWRSDVQVINQANWMKIGIKVDITNYPLSTFFGAFLTRAVPGVYDIAEFAESGAYDPDNASILQCSQTALLTHYCNPKMDALVQQEQSSGNPAVRQQAFDGIHRLELTDFPFVVAFSLPDVAIHKQGTENYAPSVAGMGETINIWQWWCDNGACPASR